MSLPHIILGMLEKESRSGYDLNRQLEMTIHYFWETDISRIYRKLKDLHEEGWVEFETIVQQESPNKKVYSITEQGRQELQRWLSEPGKSSGSRNPFLAQLHFSDAISIEDQRAVIQARLDELQEEIKELRRRAEVQNLPVPMPSDALKQGVERQLFSLEYGIRRLEFEIRWAQDLLTVLNNAEGE